MFEEIREKLWELLDWDEKAEEYIWREDGPKKVSALEVLKMFMELTDEIEVECISDEEYRKHYHTEESSIARTIRP